MSQSQLIGQRGNTLDKTVDILRKFRAEEGNQKPISNESQRERFRLAQLYGAGVKRIKDCRGRKQPLAKGDHRDYEMKPERAQHDCEHALAKLSASPLLSEGGIRNLAAIVTTSRVSVFDLIQLLSANYRVNLSREETAALVFFWDAKTGPPNRPQVDLNKVLTKLYLLAEQNRIEAKKTRAMETEAKENRHQSMIGDKYTLNLGVEVPADVANDDPAVLRFKAGAGLIQLTTALKKINKAVHKTYKRNKKEFLAMINATDDATQTGWGDGASGGGGGGISGGHLSVHNIRDYCRFNLNGLKLSIEEAIAVLIHMVPGAFETDSRSHAFTGTNGNRNAIPLDVWHKELKLIAVGVNSKLSPLDVEFDIARNPTPAKDKAVRSIQTEVSPGKSPPPRPPVDELAQEMMISDFKRINSPMKSMYAGILVPLGMENNPEYQYEQQLRKHQVSDPKRMNKEVIIPIPETLKKARAKDFIPVEATRTYLSAVSATVSGAASQQNRGKMRGRVEEDWENLDDDGSDAPSVGGRSYVEGGRGNGGRGSSMASVSSHSTQQRSVYANANTSITSGGTSHAGQGSRFIKLGFDKPMKSVPIGKKFTTGHNLNKGGNVPIRYNRHAHIRNASVQDGDENSVGSYDSDEGSSFSRQYNGEVPYQDNKPNLYSAHAKMLSSNKFVKNRKDNPADLDYSQKSELDRLQGLALKRAADEDAHEKAIAAEARKARLKDQLDILQAKSQIEFENMSGGAGGVGMTNDQQKKMKGLAEQNVRLLNDEREEAKELQQRMEEMRAQEEADLKADKALLNRLRSERKTIQKIQNQRAGVEEADENAGAGEDAAEVVMQADPNNPHRPGSPLNPYKGKKISAAGAVVGNAGAKNVLHPNAQMGSSASCGSIMSDLASGDNGSGGIYMVPSASGLARSSMNRSASGGSYANIHYSSQQDVNRIISHVKQAKRSNPEDSSVNDYSFHPLGSELTSMNSHFGMSKAEQQALYVNNKTKQRYDTKFSHKNRRKDKQDRVVVVTRDAITDALTRVPDIQRAQHEEHAHHENYASRHYRDGRSLSPSPSPYQDMGPPVHKHGHHSPSGSPVQVPTAAKNKVNVPAVMPHKRGWGPNKSDVVDNDDEDDDAVEDAKRQAAAVKAQDAEDQRLMDIYRAKRLKGKKPVVPFVRSGPRKPVEGDDDDPRTRDVGEFKSDLDFL